MNKLSLSPNEQFRECLAYVFNHEGGYINDPTDKGGPTDYGISLRFLKGIDLFDADINGDGHVNEADIHALTEKHAENFYKKYFYDHYKLEQINDLETRKRAFGFFVNMRGKTASKILQKAVNLENELARGRVADDLVEDGIAGSKTFNAINGVKNSGLLLNLIRYEAAKVYISIVRHNPVHVKFLSGWLNRARD